MSFQQCVERCDLTEVESLGFDQTTRKAFCYQGIIVPDNENILHAFINHMSRKQRCFCIIATGNWFVVGDDIVAHTHRPMRKKYVPIETKHMQNR